MPTEIPNRSLQLCSLVKDDGVVALFLDEVDVASPGDDEVLIRVEAAPINPSDLGLAFAGADITSVLAGTTEGRPSLSAPISPSVMRSVAGRLGMAIPVGNEGA